MKKLVLMIVVSLILGFWGICNAEDRTADVGSVPRMSINELHTRLADPGFIIIDVRSPHDWDDSAIMIKGAVREDPKGLDSWVDKYPKDKAIALYCK